MPDKNNSAEGKVRRPKLYWIKERHNPQLGTYYIALGKMSKTAARKFEWTEYGYNVMLPFFTEKEYNDHLAYLKEKGEKVQ